MKIKVNNNMDTLKMPIKKKCISNKLRFLRLHRFYEIRKIIPHSGDSWNKLLEN